MRHFLVISAIKFHSNIITSKTEFVEQFESCELMCIVFELHHTWSANLLILSNIAMIHCNGQRGRSPCHFAAERFDQSSHTQKQIDRAHQEPPIDVSVYYADRKWSNWLVNNRRKIASNVKQIYSLKNADARKLFINDAHNSWSAFLLSLTSYFT